MKTRVSLFSLSLVTILGTAACENAEAPAAPAEPVAPVAAAPAAATDKSDPACVGPIKEGPAHTMKVGDWEWAHKGSTLSAKTAATGKELIVGALTDIKEATPENLANLKEFMGWFKKEKVDVIVVAGDSGLAKGDIVKALDVVGALGVPVFNIIGNREGKTDFVEGMAVLRKKYPNMFNLNTVRRVDLPQATLVSMPGYFNPSYLHADDGCQYRQADVDAMQAMAKGVGRPVVLVSHGGPLQKGPTAIDRTAEGENVGDPMLTAAIEKAGIAFGIFGNIHEAGGRGVDLKGAALAEGKAHASLYINPGPADAVEWIMNDESRSTGMASILQFKDGKATYRIHRTGGGQVLSKK